MAIDLQTGWEADITPEVPVALGAGTTGARPTIMHVANFQLPPERGDYGGELFHLLGPGDVFVSLIDFGQVTDGDHVFAHVGIPLPLGADDFVPNAIVRGLPDRSAAQRFFRVGDRGYCIYVVVGSHRERADQIGEINDALASIRFEGS